MRCLQGTLMYTIHLSRCLYPMRVRSVASCEDDVLPVTTTLLNDLDDFLLPNGIIPAIRSRFFVELTHRRVRPSKVPPTLPLLEYTTNVNGTLDPSSSLEPNLERMGGPEGIVC